MERGDSEAAKPSPEMRAVPGLAGPFIVIGSLGLLVGITHPGCVVELVVGFFLFEAGVRTMLDERSRERRAVTDGRAAAHDRPPPVGGKS